MCVCVCAFRKCLKTHFPLMQSLMRLYRCISHSADVKLLENQPYVESVYEQVNAALLEYTLYAYPQFPDRFSQILLRLPELRALSTQAEDYLCYKHLSGEVPCNNLLIEMLHAKRTCI